VSATDPATRAGSTRGTNGDYQCPAAMSQGGVEKTAAKFFQLVVHLPPMLAQTDRSKQSVSWGCSTTCLAESGDTVPEYESSSP
jgi:hypothetical protein